MKPGSFRQLLFLIVILALFPVSTFALTFNLEGCPIAVLPDQEFSVIPVLDCPSCGDSYIRAVFFLSGTNYFGLTQNNAGAWIGTTNDKTQYFKIAASEVATGTYSGQLRVKLDSENSYYSGPGPYSFKLIRYTASGSKSAETTSHTIQITGPTLTPVPPTPTITPRPDPTSKPSKLPDPPTSVLLPTIFPTPTPHSVTPQPTPQVLAHTSSQTSSVSPSPASPSSASSSGSTRRRAGTILSYIGIIGLGLSGLMLVLPDRASV